MQRLTPMRRRPGTPSGHRAASSTLASPLPRYGDPMNFSTSWTTRRGSTGFAR